MRSLYPGPRLRSPVLRLLLTIALVNLMTALVAGSATAAQPARVSGGGETVITTLILSDNSRLAVEIPTHLGFSAIGDNQGAAKGQFQCLINGPGFTGNFMNLHGDVDWLAVAGDVASFGGDSNFGPYHVTIDLSGPQPAITLMWAEPFGPGAVGTEEVLTHGTIRIAG